MAYNGSGVFTLVAGNPVVSGTVISATTHNNTMSDIANNGLSNAITKDGQTTITQNIPFNSKRITGLGSATAITDAARVDQVQNSAFINLSTVAGTDTITATVTPTPSVYASGQIFVFEPAAINTGPATINISSLGAKDIYLNGEALVGNELQTSEAALIRYNGTQFDLIVTPFNVKQQSGSWMTYGGTADALTLTPSIGGAITAYVDGSQYRYKAATTNTGAATAAIDGLAAKPILTITGVALPAGYIRTSVETVMRYDAGLDSFIADRQPERGSNANGEYVRYADGTQICRTVKTLGDVLGSNILASTWTYPAAFAGAILPRVTHTLRQGATADATPANKERFNPVTVNTSNTSTSLRTFASGATDWVTGDFMVTDAIAIGFWF